MNSSFLIGALKCHGIVDAYIYFHKVPRHTSKGVKGSSRRVTYFMGFNNPLQFGVAYNISYGNDIRKGASNYSRQPGSKKCLEKCVNSSYKEECLYDSCLITLVENEKMV